MRYLFFLFLAILLILGTGCSFRDPHKLVEDRITEGFVATYVRPLSDPVFVLAEQGKDLPPELPAANRVLSVETIHKNGKRRTIFEDETKRPPSDGMTTGVDNARNIGVYYPKSPQQPEIEVRMNYHCNNGDFVAVHLSVPNRVVQKFIAIRSS